MTEHVVIPPECETAIRALWDYLDGSASAVMMDRIDEHLELCEYCRDHYDFERELVNQIHALRQDHDKADALRSRVLAALRKAGMGSTG